MSLGREIHNELRTTCQVGVLYYQHISYFQFFFPTDIMIYTEILRESLLKLQSYPLTHYADYINRVDQGFRLALQQVSFHIVYHNIKYTLSFASLQIFPQVSRRIAAVVLVVSLTNMYLSIEKISNSGKNES